jgi:hypothetical protein
LPHHSAAAIQLLLSVAVSIWRRRWQKFVKMRVVALPVDIGDALLPGLKKKKELV